MTAFDLVILPGILIAAFLGGIFIVILRFTNAKIRAAKISPELLRKQAEAIDTVIYEVETNKVSYMGIFPPELLTKLTDAHALYTERKRLG